MMVSDRRTWRDIAVLAALGVAFGVAHTQSPLYFSNQHQYFLHGDALAGVGDLQHDWLANTVDPTPVFSAGVAFTLRHLDEFVFQAVFFLLIVGYFYCLLAFGALLIPEGPKRRQTIFFLAVLLLVIHSGIARYASARWFGVDYPWFFQSGIAGQYVLGPGLQPSAFGVFLLASVVLFAYSRPALAIVLSSAACTLHPTYLLSAALLTATYLSILAHHRGCKWAVGYGLLALALAAPMIWYSLVNFAPTSAEQFREAQSIIADFRIPHHARITRWFDLIVGLQILWLGFALYLIRRTNHFWLLLVPTMLSAALTVLQYATDDTTLALFFPWRISVVLVPLATVIVFTRVAAVIPWNLATQIIGRTAIYAAAAGGIVIMANHLAYGVDYRERPVLKYIRDSKQPGDVYLIPIRVPSNSPGSRGVFSASFTPPPTGNQQSFISVDLQRFRLFTGAAIYVDFKSIPYKDVDVLEWRRRVEQCQKWYAAKDWGDPEMRRQLREEGITHVVMPANRSRLGTGYVQEYEDDSYRVYRVVL